MVWSERGACGGWGAVVGPVCRLYLFSVAGQWKGESICDSCRGCSLSPNLLKKP